MVIVVLRDPVPILMLRFPTAGFPDPLEIHALLGRDGVDSDVVRFPNAEFPFIFRRLQARRGLTQGQLRPW